MKDQGGGDGVGASAMSGGADTPVVAVLGAGSAGVQSALDLAEAGFQVHLCERNKYILSGTSDKTPGRAGLGFHYKDEKTGKRYLRSTIEVLKKHVGCTLGKPGDRDDYMSTGYYVVMKHEDELPEAQKQFGSLFHPEEILAVYEGLREYYAELIARDPSNKIFGEPEQFFRVFTGSELGQFGGKFDIDNVAAVVKTCEVLLDWPKLRAKLMQQVEAHPNITIHTETQVDRFDYAGPQEDGKSRFTVTTHKRDEEPSLIKTHTGSTRLVREASHLKVDEIVNATWENTERLSGGLGLSDTTLERTNRVKVILTADITGTPLEYQSSIFFCMGAHVMFSNMGRDKAGRAIGKFTFAPITNVAQTKEHILPDDMMKYFDGRVSQGERDGLAADIVKGVILYLPQAENIKPLQVDFGVIKTLGEVDIFDPNSKVHSREDYGVTPEQIGVTLNECRKLLHFTPNGVAVRDIVLQNQGNRDGRLPDPRPLEQAPQLSQLVVRRPRSGTAGECRRAVKPRIQRFVQRTVTKALRKQLPHISDVRRAFQIYMERYFTSDQITQDTESALLALMRARFLNPHTLALAASAEVERRVFLRDPHQPTFYLANQSLTFAYPLLETACALAFQGLKDGAAGEEQLEVSSTSSRFSDFVVTVSPGGATSLGSEEHYSPSQVRVFDSAQQQSPCSVSSVFKLLGLVSAIGFLTYCIVSNKDAGSPYSNLAVICQSLLGLLLCCHAEGLPQNNRTIVLTGVGASVLTVRQAANSQSPSFLDTGRAISAVPDALSHT